MMINRTGRRVGGFFFLWCDLCPYKVILQFYSAHIHCSTSLYINKISAFPV